MTYMPDMEIIDSDIPDKVIKMMNEYSEDAYSAEDVRRALSKDELTPDDFGALLSPAAAPFIEEIAQKARFETKKHFGN